VVSLTGKLTTRGEQTAPRWLVAVALVGGVFLQIGLAAAAWGSWTGLLAHPARRAVILAGLPMALAAAWAPFDFRRRSGNAASAVAPWIALAVGFLVFAWFPPYWERHGRWLVDGDMVRWLGVVLFIAGGVLRIWPMWALGRRFTWFDATHERHVLVTDGPYRWIRNPSYLGGLMNLLGWVLVFRSGAGLVLVALGVVPTVGMILVEESNLAAEFGGEYDSYRRRTWRLLPWVY
jgi:protein-S-isoprenylcysteine O-methyltransferase Ste14